MYNDIIFTEFDLTFENITLCPIPRSGLRSNRENKHVTVIIKHYYLLGYARGESNIRDN